MSTEYEIPSPIRLPQSWDDVIADIVPRIYDAFSMQPICEATVNAMTQTANDWIKKYCQKCVDNPEHLLHIEFRYDYALREMEIYKWSKRTWREHKEKINLTPTP